MKKRPFIIDCDTGTDDAIALIAAFGCEEIEVRAITSVNGNARETDTIELNLYNKLLKQIFTCTLFFQREKPRLEK